MNTHESSEILIILLIFVLRSPFFSPHIFPLHTQMTESSVEFNGMICRHLSQEG